MKRRISASLGLACFSSRPTPEMIMPGVQYPHCSASSSRNASCSGCSRPSFSRLSIVRIGFSATLPTGVMQERVGCPAIKTVQAPHCPSPQPYLLPVRPRSSRRTLNRLRSESALTLSLDPLTFSSVILDMAHPLSAFGFVKSIKDFAGAIHSAEILKRACLEVALCYSIRVPSLHFDLGDNR